MSRIETGSSGITPSEISTPKPSALPHDERGGLGLKLALILSSLAVLGGGGVVFKNITDRSAVRAQVTTPVDLGSGPTITDNPPEPAAAPPSPDTLPPTPPDSKTAPVIEKIKPFDNGIVSPEAYTAGEYVEWNVQEATVRGIGFILKEGEKLRIPEALIVATDEYPKPHTYNGVRVVGVSDGRRLTFIGAIKASEGLTGVGQTLPENTVVGTINFSTPVLEGAQYNLVILSSEEERLKRFPDQTKNPAKRIDNTFTAPVPGGLKLYDVKPPK